MKKEYFTFRSRRFTLTAGKKGEAISAAAKSKKGFFLRDVYGHYSTKKAIAWDSCFSEYIAAGGSDFRITSASTAYFTIAYEIICEETGAVITVVNTGRSRYYVYY